ncbi:RhoGAP domain-containing protein [Tieghemostelium lacteum]|uniref:RhoGAP domain-containing protein n=1 Tax=Tieghemostelium lacteum TaxID=361077 RepID=A0A151ZS06_TIELA|nr:RhoGAP domain-containing protein [Tieghemostelium lacteum]|eukprot:KYQ96710.1 RhoGAP domain-containing protein [Tieghemostelium lacteum]
MSENKHSRTLSAGSDSSNGTTGSSNTSSPITSLTTSPQMGSVNKNHHHVHHQKSNSGGTVLNKQLAGLLQQQQGLNPSLEDLKHQLETTTIIDLELVDDEVVINEDYDSYDSFDEDEDDDEEEYEDDDLDTSTNRSTESLAEEEELSSSRNSTPLKQPSGANNATNASLPSKRNSLLVESPKRPYSNTVSGYLSAEMPVFNRLERSESTVYHDVPSTSSPHKANSENVKLAKDKISSDYKKMLEDPEAFRNEKLKQRKSKYFSKKELEELPFAPSSGTLLKSNIYKQFMSEKVNIISENPEKYKSELLKSYISNLKSNTPKDELLNKKKTKVNRNRSQSQPPVITPNNNSKQYIGTLEAIIEKENKRDATIRKLPFLIIKCIEFLSNESALSTEGLFRVGGNAGDVDNLIKALLLYGTPIPDNTCVHVVANSIKKFLRQLTVPLFTFNFHNNFIQLTKLQTDQEKTEQLKQLLKQIPLPNQTLIQELSKFLIKVTEYSSKNMMHSYNLGLMFGPNVMRPPEDNEFNTMSSMLDSQSQIWTLILENYNTIYQDK